MKIASLSELKKELNSLPPQEVVKLCLRLASYKKENKELLNYLLFEGGDEKNYINNIKEEISLEFKEINTTNLYFAKKSVRRILRILKKYIKYSGNKETEIELLIFFLQKLKNTKIKIDDSKVLTNLYQRQLQSIEKALNTLHEDLIFDYQEKISLL